MATRIGAADGAAMRRCQQGDASALDGLMVRHQLAALRIAYVLVQDTFIAEDIVQERFLLVYQKSHLFRDGERFAPWFHQIVLNSARQHLRVAARHPEQSLEHRLNLFHAVETPLAHDLMESDPAAHIERMEIREAVLDILRNLTVKQREVLILHYYCDYTDNEMARILSIPGGTVRWRLHAALRAFERTLWRLHPWLTSQEQTLTTPLASGKLQEGARHA